MANEIGSSPLHSPYPIGPGINPGADLDNAAPAPSHGNRTHQAPQGLSGREPQTAGAMPPRQPLNFGGPPNAGAPTPALVPDNETMQAVMLQRQQTVNSTALAQATAEAQGAQGLNEFFKSMAEMKAKNIKDAGQKLAGLA